MTENEKWEFILSLDDELLKGGIFLSEWCSFIVREADIAFVNGANLAAILTATSAIETYLRSEQSKDKGDNFHNLINQSALNQEIITELHRLRQYRNKWVHFESPWEDTILLSHPEKQEQELFEMSKYAIKLMRVIIYSNQSI